MQTNGGRVLAVTALGKTKAIAKNEAYQVASQIKFEGMQFRKDIAEELISFQITINDENWKTVGVGFYDFFNRLLKITMKVHYFHLKYTN